MNRSDRKRRPALESMEGRWAPSTLTPGGGPPQEVRHGLVIYSAELPICEWSANSGPGIRGHDATMGAALRFLDSPGWGP